MYAVESRVYATAALRADDSFALDPLARLERVAVTLAGELDVLALEQRIKERVRAASCMAWVGALGSGPGAGEPANTAPKDRAEAGGAGARVL